MALPKAGVELVAEGLSGFVGDMHKASGAVSDFGSQGAGAGKDFDKGFSQVIIGGLRELGAIGVKALAEAGKAVIGFVGDSISKAGDFQQGMLEFQAVAGKSVDTKGLEEFHDLFIQIGKDLPVSTSEVQQAAIEMVKGGIDPATIAAGGLETSIKFAAAAMDGDLAKAAEISAKVVGGWAEVNATAAQKAELLAHSQDVLTKAANASTVGVDDLALGLYNVQGNAKLAGIGLDETVTTLALLAPNFSNAATAGTSLNNFITRLQPSTKPAIAAMSELGLMTTSTQRIMDFLRVAGITPLGTDIDTLGNQFTEFAAAQGFTAKQTTKIWESFAQSKFYDEITGKFIGMDKAAQLLQDATVNLTDAQRQQIFQTIFGNDAMGAAATLSRQGAEGYQQMAASLDAANGVTENAALKQAGFNTALENAKGSVEALQIQLGEKLLPILTDVLNKNIVPAINAFGEWADSILSAEKPIDALVKSIDDLVPGFESVVKTIRDVVTWFENSGDAADGLGGTLDDLNGVWEHVQKVVEDVAGAYLNIAQAVLPVVTAFWKSHGDEIMTFLKQTFDTIIQIIHAALDLYNAIVPPILNAVAELIRTHGDDIMHILENAWKVVSGVIEGALALILGIIKTATAAIQGDWKGAWEAIQQMSVDFTLALGKVISGFLETIAGFFGTSLQGIVDLWVGNWNMMVEIVQKIPGAMMQIGQDIIDGIISGLRSSVGKLWDFLINLAKEAVQKMKDAIFAGSPSRLFAEEVGEPIILGIIMGMKSLLPDLLGTMNDVAQELKDEAAALAEDIQDALSGLTVSGFQAEATIDRQKLKNLDAIEKLSNKSKESAALLLTDAQNIAAAMSDPKQAAAFFKQRSEQIFELARLTDQINATTDRAERERLIERYQLINAAQIAETKAMDAQIQQGSELSRLADQLRALLSNPAIAVGDTGAGAIISQLLNQITASQQGIPRVPQPTTTNNYYGQMGNSYNMPVQTNMTQEAIAQSWAMMGAMTP